MTPADDVDAADPITDLPDVTDPGDVEPGPAGGGEAYDPVMELSLLLGGNAERMNTLSQQGVVFNDAHPMITSMISNALLEEILRRFAGEGAVTQVLLTTHQQIADMLTTGEQQVAAARTRSKLAVPEHNGRTTRPGRITGA